MDAASGIGAVLGRIEQISSRFGGTTAESQVAVATGGAFDPFGAEYHAAVATMQSGGSSSDSFAQSYAPANPYTQTLGALTGTVSNPVSGPVSGAVSGAPSSPSAPSNAQIQAAIDGVAAAPGEHPVGGYGSVVPPGSLMVYGNGQIPSDQLATIGQGGHRLWAPAAASWQNVVAAASADGVTLKITDSYRSYAEQVDLAERKGLYQNGGLAAVPGTSPHGWGMAVDADVRDPQTADWLKVNGPRFGWVETTPREPWHWEFRPSQV